MVDAAGISSLASTNAGISDNGDPDSDPPTDKLGSCVGSAEGSGTALSLCNCIGLLGVRVAIV